VKFQEILESIADHGVVILIKSIIATLTTAMNNFDDMIHAHGYDITVNALQRTLDESHKLDWYINFLSNGTINPKVFKTKSKLQQIRSEVEQKIKSGL
jgi:hypothetical protein